MERGRTQILVSQLLLLVTVVVLGLAHVHIAGADGTLWEALDQGQVVPEH